MMNIVLSEEQAQEIVNALASTPIGRAINILLSAPKSEDESQPEESSP